MQVYSGDISYTFLYIALTNSYFIDYTNGIGQQLEALKLNISEIKNMQNNQQM